MCIMNAKSVRRIDSENFGARIIEFRVVVGKIRWFEVLRAILWIFLGLGTSLELFFKNQGSDCETSGPRVDYPIVQGPFCKISEFNRSNKLFMYRKFCGLRPWVVDHGRVAQSTVDQWWHGQEGARARGLTGGGGKWRAKHGGHDLGLTGARVAVWWSGDGDEAAVEEKLNSGNAQALGERKRRGGWCGENRWRHLPFIGAERW
jgi:hypothetical protein